MTESRDRKQRSMRVGELGIMAAVVVAAALVCVFVGFLGGPSSDVVSEGNKSSGEMDVLSDRAMANQNENVDSQSIDAHDANQTWTGGNSQNSGMRDYSGGVGNESQSSSTVQQPSDSVGLVEDQSSQPGAGGQIQSPSRDRDETEGISAW